MNEMNEWFRLANDVAACVDADVVSKSSISRQAVVAETCHRWHQWFSNNKQPTKNAVWQQTSSSLSKTRNEPHRRDDDDDDKTQSRVATWQTW